jgi:serine/threonine protein kinase
MRIHETFWNSPEGCVSIVQDFAARSSLQNLVTSVGSLPEKTLQNLTKQTLKALVFMHESNMTHSNITCSQIVFDRRGKVRLSPGFGHILRSKSETQSTLSQHNTLTSLLCESTQNFRNKQNLLKDKFTLLI